jgi:hypothetical protein
MVDDATKYLVPSGFACDQNEKGSPVLEKNLRQRTAFN